MFNLTAFFPTLLVTYLQTVDFILHKMATECSRNGRLHCQSLCEQQKYNMNDSFSHLHILFYFSDIDNKHRIKRRPQLDVAEQQDKGSRDAFMAGQNSGKQKD